MRLIEENNMMAIDKTEIDQLFASKNFIGLNKNPRSEKVIVSLTSYKPRINDIKYTIYSLLNQSLPPDKLILWLDEDSFPQREKNLPSDLLELKDFGLIIEWCENLRSYKKLIPALEKYPDDIIITADDDLFYLPDWLKILYDEHLKNPECLIAHRAYRIRINAQGNVYPHKDWYKEILSAKSIGSNFFTSGAGVLFKKSFFHDDVLRRDLFLNLLPYTDDIWFWAMTVLNDTKIIIPTVAQRDLIYVDIDAQKSGETLWAANKTRNDIYFRQVIERYPALLDKLVREATEFKPYISVVMPIGNGGKVIELLNNIFQQNFPDFELIFINLSSHIEFQSLPTNFQVVDYTGGSVETALNLGLQKATGEYILFKDEDSLLFSDSLEVVALLAQDSNADVIHFAGHLKFDEGKFILDDSLKFEGTAPIFFDESKQNRAVLWLQSKLSRRLDTKIFRREFLVQYNINFDDDLAEFMFKTLVYAEEYLLVPQAFNVIRN